MKDSEREYEVINVRNHVMESIDRKEIPTYKFKAPISQDEGAKVQYKIINSKCCSFAKLDASYIKQMYLNGHTLLVVHTILTSHHILNKNIETA